MRIDKALLDAHLDSNRRTDVLFFGKDYDGNVRVIRDCGMNSFHEAGKDLTLESMEGTERVMRGEKSYFRMKEKRDC